MIALAGEVLLDLLSPVTRSELAALGQRSSYSDSELIHSRGDPGAGMGIVIKGRVRLCVLHANGAQTFVSMVRPGQHFGDVLLFGKHRRRTHDALAEGAVLIDHYDAQAFERALDISEVLRALYRVTAQRLSGSMAMNDDLRSMPREAHLAKILLVLLRQSHSPDSVPCIQEDLAALLGTSTMTVSKCLGQLKREGLIATGYRLVRILDPERLRNWLAAKVPA
jgi:CRP/FNR family transcriptional regulator, cyclic AMP receptor protein